MVSDPESCDAGDSDGQSGSDDISGRNQGRGQTGDRRTTGLIVNVRKPERVVRGVEVSKIKLNND